MPSTASHTVIIGAGGSEVLYDRTIENECAWVYVICWVNDCKFIIEPLHRAGEGITLLADRKLIFRAERIQKVTAVYEGGTSAIVGHGISNRKSR